MEQDTESLQVYVIVVRTDSGIEPTSVYTSVEQASVTVRQLRRMHAKGHLSPDIRSIDVKVLDIAEALRRAEAEEAV